MTRQEIINKLVVLYERFYDGLIWRDGDYAEALNMAIEALKDRLEGEWIITGEEQGAFGITYKIRKCDKCGWEHSLVIPDNFCPNCGADMRTTSKNK